MGMRRLALWVIMSAVLYSEVERQAVYSGRSKNTSSFEPNVPMASIAVLLISFLYLSMVIGTAFAAELPFYAAKRAKTV